MTRTLRKLHVLVISKTLDAETNALSYVSTKNDQHLYNYFVRMMSTLTKKYKKQVDETTSVQSFTLFRLKTNVIITGTENRKM